MEQLIQDLQKAKQNVLRLLEHPDWLVDMHGLSYWAGVVERLREKIRSNC